VTDGRADLLRAEALLDARRPDEALRYALAAVAAEPSNAWGHVYASRAHSALGHREEALAFARKAVALGPEDAEVVRHHAAVLLWMEQAEEALAEVDRALALDPEGWSAWLTRTSILCDLAWYEEALVAADEALRWGAPPGRALRLKGVAAGGLGRRVAALELARASVAADPTDVRSLRLLGEAASQNDAWDEAVEALYSAVQLDPTSDDLRERLLEAMQGRERSFEAPSSESQIVLGALASLLLVVAPGLAVGAWWVGSNALRDHSRRRGAAEARARAPEIAALGDLLAAEDAASRAAEGGPVRPPWWDPWLDMLVMVALAVVAVGAVLAIARGSYCVAALWVLAGPAVLALRSPSNARLFWTWLIRRR
jgi:tetratricopeptide (TPR) repeat protein